MKRLCLLLALAVVTLLLCLCASPSLLVSAASYSEEVDPYATLEVPRTATAEQIKKSYKRLAKIWHPDKNDDPDAEANLVRIIAAYEILGDDQKRKDYDRHGHAGTRQQQQQQHRGFHDPFAQARHDWQQRYNEYYSGTNDSPHAIKLTQSNYDHFVSPNQPNAEELYVWLIYVYADYCPPCDRASPLFDEAAKQIKGTVTTARVYSDFENALTRKLGVRNVPALVAVRIQNGRITRVQNTQPPQKLSTKSIVDWAGSQFEINGNVVEVLTSPPGSATHGSVSVAELRNRLAAFLGARNKYGEAEERAKMIIVSNRSRPHVIVRQLAERYADSVKFALVCVECVSESSEEQRSVARALGVLHLWDAGQNRLPYPLLIVHREPGTRAQILPSLANDRDVLDRVVKANRFMYVPRVHADNFHDLCYAHLLPSDGSGGGSSAKPPVGGAPLPHARCLLFVSESAEHAQAAALSLVGERPLHKWFRARMGPYVEPVAEIAGGAAAATAAAAASDNGEKSSDGDAEDTRSAEEVDKDTIQLGWVDASKQSEFVRAIAKTAGIVPTSTVPFWCVLLKPNQLQYAVYARERTGSEEAQRAELAKWVASVAQPGYKLRSLSSSSLPWPLEDARPWRLPSLPNFGTWIAQWFEEAGASDGGGLVSMLLMFFVVIIFMMFGQVVRFM